jgi:hypothetical protein
MKISTDQVENRVRGRGVILLLTAGFWTDILKRDDVNRFSPPRVFSSCLQTMTDPLSTSKNLNLKISRRTTEPSCCKQLLGACPGPCNACNDVTRLKLWIQITPILFLHQGLRAESLSCSSLPEATTYSWSAPSQLQIC